MPENILRDPYILHYVSKPKPWQDNCVHPLYFMYYDYAKKTIHYGNIQPQNSFLRFWAVSKQLIGGETISNKADIC